MFTGDHVLPTITPWIGLELGEWELPLGRFLDSLRMLTNRPHARMLPAHGNHGSSVHERVLALLAHHDRRLELVVDAVSAAAGPVTGIAVADALSWTPRERPFETLNSFNKMITVCEALAHLDLLVGRGVLASDHARIEHFWV